MGDLRSIAKPDGPPPCPFRIGDVVVLKSGGEAMTVDRLYKPLKPDAPWGVGCVWHADGLSYAVDYAAPVLDFYREESEPEPAALRVKSVLKHSRQNLKQWLRSKD